MSVAKIREVAVVVPAHDEADLIGACLASVSRSAQALARMPGSAVRVRIVVVLDACQDATGSRIVVPGVEVVEVAMRCVGAARAVGAQRVLATCALAPPSLWLANTDADSTVPEQWLPEMVRHADAGADLVLGAVMPAGERTGRIEIDRWRRAHTLAEGHPYIHGANLGIRAAAYLALGGWSGLTTGEDVDLVARACLAGMPLTRTATMPVQTSSRLRGRAPDGFADYLLALTGDAASPTDQAVPPTRA